MKTIIDQLPIELCKVVLSVVQKLPQNAQLYWARNKEELLNVLNEAKNFEPITLSNSELYLLSQIKEKTRGVLWRKRYVDGMYADEFMKKILKKYLPQPSILIRTYNLNVELRANEFFSELGIISASDLYPVAFQYSQIAAFVSRHRGGKEKKSIMNYEGSNYFPIILPNGEIEFMVFCSRKPYGIHKSWKGWFMGLIPYFNKGYLFLREN